MLHLFLLSTIGPSLVQSNCVPGPNPDCKAVPGTPEWPSVAAWAALNVSTSGRLLQPAPPGAVCHPDQPTYNAAACAKANASGTEAGGWSDYAFHAADPISVDWEQYTNDSCLPNPALPCSSRGYPVYVVNATSAEHVQHAVEFAKKNHVRLIVKSSGHDYIGRSVAPNALSIWTHHLRSFQAHNSFSPTGCRGVAINHTAATVGPGISMIDLYTQLDALQQVAVGGGGQTVTPGGYLTGGGHSLLSARYGLGADNVLEMQVVTPTGRIVIANECQNIDLFWAMRGGGGSTFGIMTSVTIKTYPTPKLVAYNINIATPDTSNPNVFPMIAYVLSQFPALANAGLSGYSYIFSSIASPVAGYDRVAGFSGFVVLQDTQDPADVLKLWQPIVDHVNSIWPGQFVVLSANNTFSSFVAWYRLNHDTDAAGVGLYVGSRLLDSAALMDNTTRSAELLKEYVDASGGVATAYLVSGPGVHNAQPRGGGNAVLPAWRHSYVHSTTGIKFPPGDLTARAEALDRLNRIVEPLRQLAPNTGAYMNEAVPTEPDWQHQFWGTNYERLVSIKRSVDPDDVLWCNPCVGNERWHEVDGQLCRI